MTKKTTTKRVATVSAPPQPTAGELALLQEMEADAATPAATPDQLQQIKDQARLMAQKVAEAKELEAKAEVLVKEARKLAEEVLPNLMDSAGVKMLGLDDQTVIKRDEQVYASVSKVNAPAATEWLEDNGYGALVRYELTIPLEKGDTKLAKKITSVLTKNKIGFVESVGVHPQTLLAFVRESLKEGRALPTTITHHIQPVVKITKSK